ncbi:hypothetical protein P153DRAFT_368767 [Dothidotthia symphoricarpi CBS 119687]|uniref:Large ribosomal subunit protein mL67 n=1 Tax=Dothidotthia symphoricarpi CBS 119687 TaxID=1392245 RepID=A0A6A6A7D8_9PLEO|nr:uncharacterized protein P153DRAFT_368767 [Dothidotthia symphoricarpi CBS 119687]KAF2126698.1 hypothetical protein P153DRAFT_368767 [Dothidotthia symphoricarpi CBS 119687]
MPRTLARLTYKKPPAPINFARLDAAHPQYTSQLEKRVERHVVRQSNPKHIRLQTVVNPKSKPQSSGQTALRPIKPFTLADHVDPEGTTRHGQVIYVFRNAKTNQIIYSLQELLDNHHLAQLPFIGKHSKPPTLRPDEWIPHCVVTFPTPEQGHNAFRKLREFRKLHELSWEKTNPSWKHMSAKDRMHRIMDQRANMSADLAEVLHIQDKVGVSMREAYDEQQRKATEFMNKRWPQIDALANAAVAKEKVADNPKWLEHQIRSMTTKLKMKHNQNEADQKRLSSAKASLETRLKRITYARRKAEQFKDAQDALTKKAANANKFNATEHLAKLKREARTLQTRLDFPDPDDEHPAHIRHLLRGRQERIAELEQAFIFKAQAAARDHHIARSVLPRVLKNTLPTPFSLTDVSIKWADIIDASHAAGNWPEAILHDVLGVNNIRSDITYLSAEDFEIEKNNEVSRILSALRDEAQEKGDENAIMALRDEPELELEPPQKTGVFRYLPEMRNPFRNATV